VLDGARAVHDAQPQQRELEAGAPPVQLQAQLGVDLGKVRQVALRAVRTIRTYLAVQSVAVHVRRAAVHEWDGDAGDGFGNVAGPRHVRLLGVVGLAVGERAARLRREQEDLLRPLLQQLLQVRRTADIRGLDARAPRLQPL
jgi:hypothetical protein